MPKQTPNPTVTLADLLAIPGCKGLWRSASGTASTSWADASTAGKNLAAAAGTMTTQPPIAALNNQPYVQFSNNARLVADGMFTADGYSAFYVVKPPPGGTVWIAGDSAGNLEANAWNRDGVAGPPPGWRFQGSGTIPGTSTPETLSASPLNTTGWTIGADMVAPADYVVDGQSRKGTGQHTIDDQICVGGAVSPSPGQGFSLGYDGPPAFAFGAFYGRKLLAAESLKVLLYMARTYGVRSPANNPTTKTLVLCIGNSTTYNGPPKRLGLRLAGSLGAKVINLGISGGTIATLQAQDAEILEILQAHRQLGWKIVVLAHMGHNDGYSNIDDMKSARLQEYRKYARLIYCIPTPRTDQGPDVLAQHVATVAWMRTAEVLQYCDATVDLAADSRLNPINETYYGDLVHQNDAGMEAIAELQQPVVEAQAAQAYGEIDPKAATATASGQHAIILTAPAADGGRGLAYQWYRSTDGATWDAIAGATSLNLTDSGLAPGSARGYIRRATDAAGFYAETEPAWATTDPPPQLVPSAVVTPTSPTTATLVVTTSGGQGGASITGVAIAGGPGTSAGSASLGRSFSGLAADLDYSADVTVSDGFYTVTVSAAFHTPPHLSATIAVEFVGVTGATATIQPVGGTGSTTVLAWRFDGQAVPGTSLSRTFSGLLPLSTHHAEADLTSGADSYTASLTFTLPSALGAIPARPDPSRCTREL
jgi:hypothetical protein